MSALLAAMAAVFGMGCANFLGPLMTRRTPVLTVVGVGQGTAALGVFAILLFNWQPLPGVGFLFGAIGLGVVSAFATSLAFRAGQVGHIGLVSVIAAASAIVPAVGGVLGGDVPGLWQWMGILLATGGTVLTLLAGDQTKDWADTAADQARKASVAPRAVDLPVGAATVAQAPHPAVSMAKRASYNWPLMSVAAAVGFGIFLFGFGKLAEQSLLWVGVISRSSMAIAAGAAMVAFRLPAFAPGNRRRQLLPLPPLGVLMMTAVLLYGYAATTMLTVAGALTAFAPVVTVSLGWIILRERLTRTQIIGVVITVGGLVLVAV